MSRIISSRHPLARARPLLFSVTESMTGHLYHRGWKWVRVPKSNLVLVKWNRLKASPTVNLSRFRYIEKEAFCSITASLHSVNSLHMWIQAFTVTYSSLLKNDIFINNIECSIFNPKVRPRQFSVNRNSFARARQKPRIHLAVLPHEGHFGFDKQNRIRLFVYK